MKQRELIHNYIEKTTDKFNEKLFNHSDQDIIDSLKKIILSCERTGLSTIKVLKFTVVDDYFTIKSILSQYEDKRLQRASSKNKGIQVNKWDYIDLRSSALKLLLVDYYIAANGESETIQVIIAVPRVVNKFYFKLNGCLYSAMYQVVDASTYNTSTTKASNKHSVTLKVLFQAIRIYRNIYTIKTIDGIALNCTNYVNDTFKKQVPILQFMFAKFGFYKCLEFMNLYGTIILTDAIESTEKYFGDDEYVFKSKKANIFIHVPKMIYDRVSILQHIVYILVTIPVQTTTLDDIFSNNYWIEALGAIFNTNVSTMDKGLNILSSLEFIYDIQTKEEIHLPEEYKHDSYCILRWMIWEYNNLRIKDNLNILTKKLRWGEYIGAKYAAKISRNIYRLSDKGKETDLKTIKRAICTDPMYVIQQMITKDQLINFRGIVTDMDSLLAIKFTYKGEAGIKTISNAYKLIHPTNLGILDPDSSSPSDPGSSGTIVPMVQLYGNNYFSEFKEPLTFEKDYAALYNNFKEAKGAIQIYNMEEHLLGRKRKTAEEMIESQKAIDAIREMIDTVGINPEYEGLPLEGSGHIQYE